MAFESSIRRIRSFVQTGPAVVVDTVLVAVVVVAVPGEVIEAVEEGKPFVPAEEAGEEGLVVELPVLPEVVALVTVVPVLPEVVALVTVVPVLPEVVALVTVVPAELLLDETIVLAVDPIVGELRSFIILPTTPWVSLTSPQAMALPGEARPLREEASAMATPTTISCPSCCSVPAAVVALSELSTVVVKRIVCC